MQHLCNLYLHHLLLVNLNLSLPPRYPFLLSYLLHFLLRNIQTIPLVPSHHHFCYPYHLMPILFHFLQSNHIYYLMFFATLPYYHILCLDNYYPLILSVHLHSYLLLPHDLLLHLVWNQHTKQHLLHFPYRSANLPLSVVYNRHNHLLITFVLLLMNSLLLYPFLT